MRLSELLGAEVRDPGGKSVGVVHDVRLRRDLGSNLANETFGTMWVDALVVGPGGFAGKLGFGRRPLAGPAPLSTVLHRCAERSCVVAVQDLQLDLTDETSVRAALDARPRVLHLRPGRSPGPLRSAS